MGKNIFYYAVRMDNGMVVRVAKEASSLLSIFRSAFPILGIVLVLTFVTCFILTHYLAKSLITPIEGVANNMDHIENVQIYKELEPFVTTIKQQHEDILKSAMMRQEFTANVTHELKTPLTSDMRSSLRTEWRRGMMSNVSQRKSTATQSVCYLS